MIELQEESESCDGENGSEQGSQNYEETRKTAKELIKTENGKETKKNN